MGTHTHATQEQEVCAAGESFPAININNSFFLIYIPLSALLCSSQNLLCSVLLLSVGVESQRDQSGLLPGYNL